MKGISVDRKKPKIIGFGFTATIYLVIIMTYALLKFTFNKITSYEQNMIFTDKLPSLVSLPALFIILFVIQLFINLNNLKETCGGNVSSKTPLMSAATTMFFIFGGIVIALAMNESWKSPFGNTFGYVFAGRFAGASTKDVTYDLIEVLKKSNRKPKEIETLDRLLTDHTLLINEITPSKFNDYINTLNVNVKTAQDTLVKLYNIILAKDIISELIWYFLTMILVTTLNSNKIMSVKCQHDEKKLLDAMKEIEIEEAKEDEDEEDIEL